MATLFNALIQKYFVAHHQPEAHDMLNQELAEVFQNNGEGLYYACFHSDQNDWISAKIGTFCEDITHVQVVLYSDNIRDWFTKEQWLKITNRWKFFYGNTEALIDVKALVLGSADKEGMNFHDFSSSQNRNMILRKVPNSIYSRETQLMAAQWFVEVPYDYPYDFLGLFAYPISKKIYDRAAYYCSNQLYDGMKSCNIFVAPVKNPRPNDINDYNRDWIVYKTPNGC